MELPPDEFFGLIAQAGEQTREARYWQMYLSYLPWMTEDNRVSYGEFLASIEEQESALPSPEADLSPEEIDAKFTKIARLHQQKQEEVRQRHGNFQTLGQYLRR